MESKKINFKKILNTLIISMSILLVGIFIGICFFLPVANVKALDKDTIVNAYNINFVSAKTKVRQATDYKKEDINNSDTFEDARVEKTFSRYNYTYSNVNTFNYDEPDTTKLYYSGNAYDIYNNSNGDMNLVTTKDGQTINLPTYKDYYSNFNESELTNAIDLNGFIPYEIDSYKDVHGNVNDIFYDEFDNNDVVLLNNNIASSYKNSSGAFNVENLYLSFGDPYFSNNKLKSTALASLRVEATFYPAKINSQPHTLILNSPATNEFETDNEDLGTLHSVYWHQYLDLKNLSAKITVQETGGQKQLEYKLNNQEGKYVFKFYFIRWNKDFTGTIKPDDSLNLTDQGEEIFEYSFYLYDSNTYSDYPTISNADVGLQKQEVMREYFYNFQNDFPTLTYNPERFNLSYVRENVEIIDRITSSFTIKKYKKSNNEYYPLGIITYKNGAQIIKTVYILAYPNADYTQVQYIYAHNDGEELPIDTYSNFLNLLQTEDITFEYKDVETLTYNGSTKIRTINKTRTYEYDNVSVESTSGSGFKDLYTTSETQSDYDLLTSQKLLDETLTPEKLEIHYLYDLTFDRLGVYTFDYKYIATYYDANATAYQRLLSDKISDDLKINPLTTNSSNKTNPIDFNQYNTLSLNAFNKMLANTTPKIDGDFSINAQDVYLTISSELKSIEEGISTANMFGGTITVTQPAGGETIVSNSNMPTGITIAPDVKLDTDFNITIGSVGLFAQFTKENKGLLDLITLKIKIGQVRYTPVTYSDGLEYKDSGSADPGEIYNEVQYNVDSYVYSDADECLNIINATLDNNSDGSSELKSLIDNMKTFLKEALNFNTFIGNTTINANIHNNLSVELKSHTQHNDRLHIFGSVSYFAKEDSSTDAKLAEFKLIDNKNNKEFYSDFSTDLKSGLSGITVPATSSDAPVGYDHMVNNNGPYYIANKLIVTDVTPIQFKNLSTLTYEDTYISKSKITRYSKYKVVNNDDFTKNVYFAASSKIVTDLSTSSYIQHDGLYIVTIEYTYTNYKMFNKDKTTQGFTQTFAFVIDNTSPEFNIELKNEDGTYAPIDADVYTNKDVRISWKKPTYFQHSVYLEIDKEYFNNYKHETTGNFNAFYNAKYTDETNTSIENIENGIINNYEVTQGFVNNVTSTIDPNDTTADRKHNYYVYISSKDKNNYPLNGCYDISIHYSSDGNSILTESFTIDTLPIDGQEILGIFKNDNDQYVVGYAHEAKIINSAFTFIYNPKKSGARIDTYWHKIQFNSSSNYDKLYELTDTNKTAITTNYSIYADDENIATETEYLYNYNIKTTFDSEFGLVKGDGLVENGCYFTAESSAIYLFRMIDQAGNTSEYVVMVDKTNPRYIVTPTVKNKNNIVNDTTEIIWSDYKAIELELPTDFDLNEEEPDEKTAVARLKQTLNYMLDSNNNADFENFQIKSLNGKQHALLPVDYTYIEDVNYSEQRDIKVGSDEPTKLYLFPADPTIMYDHDNDTSTPDILGVQLPKYDNTGKAVYDANGTLQKVTYPVVGEPKYTKVTDLQNYTVDRRISLTYTANDKNIKLSGVIGSGTFNFSVFDKIKNRSDGLIWMNLDKTQTFGYALFDYSGKIKNSVGLISEVADTYALSRLYMTSLKSDGNAIPHYEVTYKYYKYNANLYNNYDVISAEMLTESNGMYLLLHMQSKSGITPAHEQDVKIQLTEKDIDGKEYQYPTHTYPYDLAGDTIISNAQGMPEHIYNDHTDSYVDPEEPNRIFSTTINMNRDDKGNDVTQEGLYVFKREYTQSNINLGTDSRIIYRIYYVDRSGIINITTANSISSNLYEIGKDINYIMGDNYAGDNAQHKHTITAENIQTKQAPKVSTTANTYNIASNLFETNKIRVAFNLTTDKYGFYNFVNIYNDVTNLLNKDANNYSKVMIYENADEFMRYTLLNTPMFEDKIYKVDLKLTFGSIPLVDESYTDVSQKFNDKYIKTYLRGIAYSGSGYEAKRSNNFNFFYGDINSSYKSGLGDQADYKTIDLNTKEVKIHTAANTLDMSFHINHNAPNGEIYGKYGDFNYDENDPKKENPLSNSIPLVDSDPNPDVTKLAYKLISTYWEQGNLQALTNVNEQIIDMSGNYVRLASINNETLVFMFAVTNDQTKAQIDPNNVKIYKDGTTTENIIFHRTTSSDTLWGASTVSSERMERAFIDEVIDNIHYYAIIIFDDNLEDILDEDEQDYKNLRLLDPLDLNDGDDNFLENTDDSTYYVDLQYIGTNREDYQGMYAGHTVNYYSSRFEIIVDRIKPTYNLSKLIDIDNYVYNPVTTTLTNQNYLKVFDEYKPYYNYKLDEAHEFERSDLEKYFFAVDSRKNYSTNTDISFTFESVHRQDSNSSIYIRKIDPNSYKFSLTPDDIKAYSDASYLSDESQQFTPSTAILIDDNFLKNNTSIAYDNYYEVLYAAYGGDISIYELCEDSIIELGQYYEIIEHDEAGNYRVYAIYVPDLSSAKNNVAYNYQINNSTDTIYESLSYGFYPYATPYGLSFRLDTINTEDKYLKAIIDIDSDTLLETIVIYYNPLNTTMYITKTDNTILDEFKISNPTKYKEEFIDIINSKIIHYENLMKTKLLPDDTENPYYSQYGFNLSLSIVNRVGVLSQGALHNYEFDYSVAGSILEPIITYGTDVFSMIIPAKIGSTYITKIRAYRFNSSWQSIDVDSKGQSFYKSINDLMNGVGIKEGSEPYIFTRGVYMFNITDNYNRTNIYYEEIGVAAIQKGGQFTFTGNHVIKDDYTYTAKPASFSYDSSVYDIQIKFTGIAKDPTGQPDPETGELPNKSYSSQLIYSSKDKATYLSTIENFGISQTIVTIGNVTTITFNGVTDLSQYDIKIIHSIMSENYHWGDELNDPTIFVYNKNLSIYDVVPEVILRNMNGSILNTSNQLNLTEDFELLLSWPATSVTRINFNSVIELTRKYQEDGIVRSYTQNVQSGYIVSLPGEYTARVINDLGATSRIVSFNRSDGDISMYAVYSIDNETFFTETKLNPSLYVEKNNDNNIIFTYYSNADYFAYTDQFGTANYQDYVNNANNFGIEHLESFKVNNKAKKYIEIRVNSNLNIFADICEIGLTDDNLGGLHYYPYVMYRIYTTSTTGEDGELSIYTYRYVRIIYLEANDSTINLASLQVNGVSSNTSLIKSTENKINITFAFTNETGKSYVPLGDAIYIDRYYNGEFLDSTMLDMVNITESTMISYNIKTVGLYEFVVRDLAGRTHKFNIDNNTTIDKLQVYLVNQILYYVNGSTPLNNQVFNDKVDITVISELAGLTLYNTSSIGVTVTKNGKELSSNENTSNLSFSEAGYYTIKMVATTTISSGTANIASQEITSTYSFAIIKTNVAQNNFSISKGKGLILDKLIKKTGEEIYDLTEEYLQYVSTDKSMSTNSLWLTYESKYEGSKIFGNAVYTITLKALNNVTEKYDPFTFNIWINNEKPTIISNIPAGSETKENITIDFNPGLIYTQIGKCYLQLNGNNVVTIDENSQTSVTTLTISQNGTHVLKIVSDDGSIVSSYKYVKSEPLNNVTKFVIIGVVCLAVVLTGVFIFIRRKGKYR